MRVHVVELSESPDHIFFYDGPTLLEEEAYESIRARRFLTWQCFNNGSDLLILEWQIKML